MNELDSFKLMAHENDRVRYVPGHANGDANHPDCEDGTISSFSNTSVFVKFDNSAVKFGWEGATSQACNPQDLRVL